MSGGWEYAGAACLSGGTGSLCKSYDPLYPDSRNPFPGKKLNIIDALAECDFGEFENKKVLVLGLAKSGEAAARLLAKLVLLSQ